MNEYSIMTISKEFLVYKEEETVSKQYVTIRTAFSLKYKKIQITVVSLNKSCFSYKGKISGVSLQCL